MTLVARVFHLRLQWPSLKLYFTAASSIQLTKQYTVRQYISGSELCKWLGALQGFQ